MAFEKKAPEWGAAGIEPPESKRQTGWEVEDRPPAAWLNWFMNLTAESLAELQQKAAEKEWVEGAIAEIDLDIQQATLSAPGIVQLSNETNGTREDRAATEKAVSLAFQAGNERKAEVVAALVALGVSASTSETWAQLIPKMASIIRATGDATAADLLAGKKASNASGPFTGTMPNQGAAIITPSGTGAVTIPDGAYKGAKVAQVSVPPAKVLNDTTIAGVAGTMANQGAQAITPGTANKAIPAGYHNGSGYVVGDADLVAGNIPKDVNLFGVQGILERLTTVDRNAIIAAITGKGVAASAADSNAVLAQKIGQIITGKRIATGSTISGNTSVATLFYTNRGNGIYKYPLTVTGLDFTPTTVIVFLNSLSGAYANFAFKSNLPGFPSDAWLSGQATGRIDGGSSAQATVVDETFRIFANGFCAPVPSNGWSHGWIAIE